MELLIEGITNSLVICGSKESPKDISEWKEVHFNDTNEIIKINWYARSLKGSIELKWLPLSSQVVYLSYNSLTGTADLTSLPDGLQKLSLSGNKLEGTVDLTKLPASLSSLLLNINSFQGHTDLSKLPKSLSLLNVANTQLEGEIAVFDGALVLHESNVKDMRKGEGKNMR